jgi:hypothetical protein
MQISYRVSTLSGGRERKIMKFIMVRWEETECTCVVWKEEGRRMVVICSRGKEKQLLVL